jgi:enoyl-CoA hydratase
MSSSRAEEAPTFRLLGIEIGEGTAVLTLTDPGRRNALSLEMSDELVRAFDFLESTPDVRAVIVTGAPPAFCAGADLGQLVGADERTLRRIYAGFVRTAQCPLFTLAAVNGAAVGAGTNLALACDVRIAGERASFDTRFVELGLHPGGGHTHLVQRAVSQSVATALLLGGMAVDGKEAERLGLVLRCVPDKMLIETCRQLARPAATAPRELGQRCKASISHAATSTFAATIERELAYQLWSVSEPAFGERIAALQQRLARRTGTARSGPAAGGRAGS